MRVSDLTRQKPVEAVVDIGDGDEIKLTFDRNKITPDWLDKHQERAATRNANALGSALGDVLIAWDVYQETPGDYPPSAENMAVLSLPAQNALFDMILELSMPSRAEGNVSSASTNTATSTSTPPLASLPNGTVTLPSPTPSESLSPT
jgi:hypothetical protein